MLSPQSSSLSHVNLDIILMYPSGIHRPGTKALQQHKALFRFQTFSAFLLAPHVGLEEVAT